MTVPTIHATQADLRSELWWDENVCPVARANGLDPDDSRFGLHIDSGGPACQYLKHPDGRVLLIVRVRTDADSARLSPPQTARDRPAVGRDTTGPSTAAQEAL